LVGSNGLIFAIEPFPQAFSELKWHIQANNCFNVKAEQVAVSDNDGESLFNIGESPSEGGLSNASVTTNREGQIKVATRTLDSLVDEWELKKLRLVKIDVEGAESVVLSGAGKVVESYRPHFIIDLHSPEQDVSVARLLTSWGYFLSRISGPPILHTDTGWPDIDGVWGTILATHKA
jgi:FkbM family methyltransferase